MRYLISAMLFVVGIIHLLPLPGVLGSGELGALYGVSVDEPNLSILMRHRAVLFGLLGSFLLLAAWRRQHQPAAIVGGVVSVLSFIWLAWSTGSYNEQLARVFKADVVALICLIVAAAAYAYAYDQDP